MSRSDSVRNSSNGRSIERKPAAQDQQPHPAGARPSRADVTARQGENEATSSGIAKDAEVQRLRRQLEEKNDLIKDFQTQFKERRYESEALLGAVADFKEDMDLKDMEIERLQHCIENVVSGENFFINDKTVMTQFGQLRLAIYKIAIDRYTDVLTPLGVLDNWELFGTLTKDFQALVAGQNREFIIQALIWQRLIMEVFNPAVALWTGHGSKEYEALTVKFEGA